MKKLVLTAIFFLIGISSANALTPPMPIFKDVYEYEGYWEAIQHVKEYGIVDGYSDGTFRPDNPITRGEFTKILMNVLFGEEGEEDEVRYCIRDGNPIQTKELRYVFPDVDENQSFANYICIAKKYNIISGYSDGLYRPDNYISVGEASKIVANTYFASGDNVVDENNDFEEYMTLIRNKNNALPAELKASDLLKRGEMAYIIYKLRTAQWEQGYAE